MKLENTQALESFRNIIWRDPKVRAVLILAVIVRLFFVGYLSLYPDGIFANGDSKDYHQLAQYFLYYNAFGREDISPEAIQKPIPPPLPNGKKVSLIPETFRVPLYPVFLATIYRVSSSPVVVVAVQSLISLFTVWLIILLMARLFQPSAAWLAGLLAALDPLGLIYTHHLMTESLFLCFLVLGVYVFVVIVTSDGHKKVNLLWPILGGLAIGSAALTRPVGIYFPVFLIGLWIVGAFGRIWQKLHDRAAKSPGMKSSFSSRFGAAPKLVIIFLASAFLLPALWSVRNYYHYSRFMVSSCGDHDLLPTITAQMVAKIRNPAGNILSWDIYEKLEDELAAQMESQGLKNPSEPERAVYIRNWCLNVIKDHPGLFVHYYFKGMAILFIPDVPAFFELFGFTSKGKGALGAVFRQGLHAALIRYFGEHWLSWVAAALPIIVLEFGVYALAMLGIAAMWRTRDFSLLFIILAIIGYWLAVAAIGAAPRYRAPAMPFLDVLAAWGLFNVRNFINLGSHRVFDRQSGPKGA